jgi:hypothetical protein
MSRELELCWDEDAICWDEGAILRKHISEAERDARAAGVIEGMERAAEICNLTTYAEVEIRSEIEKMKGSK